MDQIWKVGGSVFHLGAQVAPELDVLVESGGEVGHWPFCSLTASEGDLHHVEVPDDPRQGKVHGAELVNEALQILEGYTTLYIWYLQKGDYLEVLLGRQYKGTPVGVN